MMWAPYQGEAGATDDGRMKKKKKMTLTLFSVVEIEKKNFVRIGRIIMSYVMT